jgi:hypothetical protein
LAGGGALNFVKGLILTCGAAGAALVAISVTGMTFKFKAPDHAPVDKQREPQIVTLAPIPLKLGPAGDVVRVSLRLTVPGGAERQIVCAKVRALQATAERLVGDRVALAQSLPPNLSRVVHAAIAGIVGDRQIERVDIAVTPMGATPPPANCAE